MRHRNPAIPDVGEIVILNSPHVGEDSDVQYRGKIGDEATIILNGYQMSVPMAWLRRKPRAIVIAWTVSERVKVGDWSHVRIDLEERGEFEDVDRPVAAMWLNSGTDADVEKARAHARTIDETARVFTFAADESDPIGAAKRAIVA